MWRGAWITVATLFGGLALGIGAGDLTFRLLPGSNPMSATVPQALVSAVPMALVVAAASATWGVAIGQLAGDSSRRRLAIAGILGFLPITLILAFALFGLEGVAVDRIGQQVPIHRLFTLLFVPTAFLIGAVSAWAIGLGLRDNTLARTLFWRVGLAAAGSFLVVNLLMEWAGWVVGAPGAAERATMLVVMFSSNLAAALAGGAVLGRSLSARRAAVPT
jgi:hypothetical protein